MKARTKDFVYGVEEQMAELKVLERSYGIADEEPQCFPQYLQKYNEPLEMTMLTLTLVFKSHDNSNFKGAICDKIKQSAEGAIQAVIEFVTDRKKELNESDISRSVIALTAFFRGGGKVGKKAVEQRYASVLATLVLHFDTSR
ncbi:unnamed protein product [Fraxinus pennsylvanica]|uniref:Uncharacterized protein n=1 Tax=Fraxinus pennsylvanica TaxID=56036 RepID=A0AAD1YXG7_9LAMI|nr:unnamed protein product [Fraxinus pennsylvanica]